MAVILFSWLLLIMSVIDIDHQLLPDSLVPLLWLGLAYNSLSGSVLLMDAVWGAIAATSHCGLFTGCLN